MANSNFDIPMANYGFGNATLQSPPTYPGWGESWEMGGGSLNESAAGLNSGFNLSPMSPKFGEYDFSLAQDGSQPWSMMAGGGGSPAGSGGFLDGMLGSTQNGVTTQGWGGMALGAASALSNAYMGMKQYGLAKDSLKFQKDAFAKNFDAQRKATNSSLEDRQRARVASNSGAYESVSSYMNKNGIK